MATPFPNGSFITSTDFLGLPYFVFITQDYNLRNASKGADIASFVRPWIGIAPESGPFLTRIPYVDNLILALLLLLFLLLLELLIASLRPLFPTVIPPTLFSFLLTPPPSLQPVNSRQARVVRGGVAVPVVLGAVTLALQLMVLGFTGPYTRSVSNAESTFQLTQPFNPDWNAVWNFSLILVNQPCLALSFLRVSQDITSITSCMSSTVVPSFSQFQVARDVIDVNISSRLHAYGAEHEVRLGNVTAVFSARALMRLNDLKPRLLEQRVRQNDVDIEVAVVHRQMIAYLFSAYRRETGDESMSLERLNQLDFSRIQVKEGPVEEVARVDEGREILRVRSVVYETVMSDVIPGGEAALRFAGIVLRSAIAVEHVEGGTTDLLLGVGKVMEEGVVWNEAGRRLNWLGMLVAVGVLSVTVAVVKLVVLVLMKLREKDKGREQGVRLMGVSEMDDRGMFTGRVLSVGYVSGAESGEKDNYAIGAEVGEARRRLEEEYEHGVDFDRRAG